MGGSNKKTGRLNNVGDARASGLLLKKRLDESTGIGYALCNWVRVSKIKNKEVKKMPSRTYNGYTELPKWDVKEKLLSYMAQGKTLYFDERENGVLVSGTIAGVRERDGKVYFSMSTNPTNFRYLGGRGWYIPSAVAPVNVASPAAPVERSEALRSISDRLLDAINDNSTEGLTNVLRDLATTLRVSAS